jgi:molecular chaperone GrpE
MTKKHTKHDREEEAAAVVPPQPEGPAHETGECSSELAQLAQALEQKTKEAADANEKYLRAAADFENFRKRIQRDTVEFRKYANEQLALELLSVVDHLGLALKHAGSQAEGNQALQEGVELVYKQFHDVLEKFGVKPFAAQGEPFDPARHDALMQVESDDMPENTVVAVLQDGYVYYDKVLRHAKVSVSKKPEHPAEVAGGEELGGEE